MLGIVIWFFFEIDGGGHIRIKYLGTHGLVFIADFKHFDIFAHAICFASYQIKI